MDPVLLALTRSVPPSITRCQLTHLERVPIDPLRAAAQHAEYEHALELLGCTVEQIAPAPDFPDSVFVEDTAVVLDEIAIVTRPGAESRRGETPEVARALASYRRVECLTPPAVMDGGDVMRLGKDLFVGLSSRTNDEAVGQLASMVGPFGYAVHPVRLRGCLHLKSAACAVHEDRLLHNPHWVDAGAFFVARALSVHPREPFAANVLRVGDTLLMAAGHAETAGILRNGGYDVHLVDVSELAKAEGGVTCCSLILS